MEIKVETSHYTWCVVCLPHAKSACLPVIEETQANTKHHVYNTKHNRKLHFERVGECEFVHSNLPYLELKETECLKQWLKNSQFTAFPVIKN